ncbi:uncharacterized protein LOC121632933 [Tachysurus ichikawai]
MEPLLKTEPLPSEQPLTLSTSEVCATLGKVNARKALRACTEQLAGVFTDIFNLFLAQAIIPTVQVCYHRAGAKAFHCNRTG